MEDRRFYVYRYIIKTTGEVIYIGKGSGSRHKRTDQRNKYFTDMYNSHDCEVQILQRNLTETEAFKLEKLLIAYYRKFTHDRLTNICDGGEGASGHHWSEEQKREIGLRGLGENNPNYNHRWTDEMKDRLRIKQRSSGRYVGHKNPNAKRIQCVETGEIFNCIIDAKSKYNVKCAASFTIALSDSHRTAAGLHWRYLPEQ